MRAFLRRVLRFVLRPTIWFVRWAVVQADEIHNQETLKRLDLADPAAVSLHGRVRIAHPERCRIGRGVAIHDADWGAHGGITIGDHVHFGPRVTILTLTHDIDGEALPYDSSVVHKPVVIEDNVWVGCDVVIAPGTYIEEGCVISMGATVSGRIPKGSIVGSQKWRVLRSRNLTKYEQLKANGKFH